MPRKTSIALVALIVGHAGWASAQTQGTPLTPSPKQPASRVGTRGANFLEIGVGARGQALAGAYTGLATGATSMYWNPAGLGATSGLDVVFSRSDLYSGLGITHTFAGVVLPLFGGGLGVSYNKLDSGEIPRTDEQNPDGGDVQFGNVFSWTGTSVGLHYGRRLTDRLSVGFAGKTVTEGMNGAATNWWGVDIGTQFSTGLYGISVGAALTNVGSASRVEGSLITRRVSTPAAFSVDLPVRYTTTPAQLPTSFRFSVVQRLAGGSDGLMMANGSHNMQLLLELSDAVDSDLQSALALEYNYRNVLYIRGGKRWVNEADASFRSGGYGLSWGGGVRLPLGARRVSFDYAYTNMGDLSNVQVFTFEFGN
jgi:hypothetical protein